MNTNQPIYVSCSYLHDKSFCFSYSLFLLTNINISMDHHMSHNNYHLNSYCNIK